MTDRDALANEIRALIGTPNASPSWKAAQVMAWLDRHRVVLCNHGRPAWSCDTDCPAFQAAMSRAFAAERRLTSDDLYRTGYDDGYAAAWAELEADDPDREETQ